MKKNLIAATALIAFAGAASAQVAVYGLVDMCYGKSLYSDIIGDKAQFHSGGDNGNSECNSTTRVGVKASADLGGGMKANAAFESNGITSSGTLNSPSIGRKAYFGLAGSFGEVRVGRMDSVPFAMMSDFDFNGASNGVSAGAYSNVGVFNKPRQSAVLQYIAPTMGGFSSMFGLQPKGNRGPNAKDVFSAGVKYAAGPLAVGVSLQTKDDSASKDFTSIAGTYDFSVAKVMLGYTDSGAIASGGGGKGPSLGVTFPIAGFSLGAIYAQNTDSAAKVKSYELFANKEIFKNTYGYIEGGNWKSDTLNQSYSGYAAGVIFVF
jgi:predicted porin